MNCSQTLALQRWLAAGHTITPLQALMKFGTLRLSGRIYDLKKLGWPVKSRLVKMPSGRRVAEYRIDRKRK